MWALWEGASQFLKWGCQKIQGYFKALETILSRVFVTYRRGLDW